jgi:endonuclease III-like uncharacterized protein
MAELLLERHNGVVPQTYEELEALPGVGHKTASVVMSQGFGFPAFPVDTHIHRLMTQWKLTSGKNVVETEKDAKNSGKKKSGINFIFRLFSTEENILPREETEPKISSPKCCSKNKQSFPKPEFPSFEGWRKFGRIFDGVVK